MADKGGKTGQRADNGNAAPLTRGGGFVFTAMLTIADILPVMVSKLDRDLRYRFVNKPYADWFELPRSALLGKALAEIIGQDAAEYRAPMLAAALGGHPQSFVSDYGQPTRGPVAVQTSYVPWTGSDGT